MIIIKTKEQIERIRESCKLLAELHNELRSYVCEGMTTKDIDMFCYDFIVKHKAKPAFLNYMGYPASACVSVNEEIIHGIPGKKKIVSGDIVSIDIGIDLNGYISDAAQTIAIGKTTPEIEKLIRITRECLDKAVLQAVAGNRIHDISRAVFKHATANGFSVVREYCGHGVGLEVHEEPQIPNYVSVGPNPRIKPGMVLAIEPMINLGKRNIKNLDDGWTVITADGLPSAHWEHTVAVFEDHMEILTAL